MSCGSRGVLSLKMRTDQMENTEENYNKGATNGKDATDE